MTPFKTNKIVWNYNSKSAKIIISITTFSLIIAVRSFGQTTQNTNKGSAVIKADSTVNSRGSSENTLPDSSNVLGKCDNSQIFKISRMCGDNTYTYTLTKNAASGYTVTIKGIQALADNIGIIPLMQNSKTAISDSSYYLDEKVNSTDLSNWLNVITGKKCPDACNALAEKIHDAIETTQVNNTIAQKSKQIDSLAQLLVDYDRVAGQIKLNKTVVVDKLDDRDSIIGSYFLNIQFARLQIDRNRIEDFTFVATVRDSANMKMLNDSLPISNSNWSLSFGRLNQGEYSTKVKFTDKTDNKLKKFKLRYGDLIHYLPKNGNFSFVTQSREYELKPDSVTTIYKRAYSDYFSFRTFLDPLGFLSNTPNGFAQLEGDAIVPLKLYSRKSATWFNYFHANFSYIYSNSINNTPRLANAIWLANDTTGAGGRPRNSDSASNYINNLDFVQKSYYQFYARGSIYSLEVKKANTWINFELGTRVLGSRITGKDTSANHYIDTFTVHKFIPEFNVCWEWRPDDIFGGNLNLGISYIGNVHRGNNAPSNILNPSFLWKSPWAFPHELNLYVLTSSKGGKGGLFFRYSGWLSLSNKLADHIDKTQLPYSASINKTSYFPQILFGYSTNLSALIKKSN